MSEGNSRDSRNGFSLQTALYNALWAYDSTKHEIRKDAGGLIGDLKSQGLSIDGHIENTVLGANPEESGVPCKIAEIWLRNGTQSAGRLIHVQKNSGDGRIDELIAYVEPKYDQLQRTEALSLPEVRRIVLTSQPGETESILLRYEQVMALYLGINIPATVSTPMPKPEQPILLKPQDRIIKLTQEQAKPASTAETKEEVLDLTELATAEDEKSEAAKRQIACAEIQIYGPEKMKVTPVQLPAGKVYISDNETAPAKERIIILSDEDVAFTEALAELEGRRGEKKAKIAPLRPSDDTPLDTTLESAVAYLEGRQLLDEMICDGGIVRRMNLANVQNCIDPRKNEPYSRAYMDMAMTQTLVSAFDDLVRIEYDTLVFIGGKSAFMLGSKEMFRPYIKAADTPLEKDCKMELVRKLKESLKDEKLTPEQFKRISKSMLANGQLYAAMDAMCRYNSDALLLYELNNAEPAALISHIFSRKGDTAVFTLDDDLLVGIIDELCRNKRSDQPDRYRQMINFENHSITRNGRATHFVGKSTKDRFLRYVTCDTFMRENLCTDIMIWQEDVERWQEEELAKNAGFRMGRELNLKAKEEAAKIKEEELASKESPCPEVIDLDDRRKKSGNNAS